MKRIIYMLLALLAVAGCTQEPPLPPSIEIGGDIIVNIGDSVEVGAKVLPEESNQKLIYSLSSEDISNISDYITVDGNGVLHAIALPPSPVFTLSIVSPEYGIARNVKVILQYDPEGGIASLDADGISVSSPEAYSQEVKVTRKTEKTSFYEIKDVPEWIEVTLIEKGSLVDTYSISIQENRSPDERHAVIWFGDHEVSVNQKGVEIWLSIPPVTEIHAGAELKLEARMMPNDEIAAVEWYISGGDDIIQYVEVYGDVLKSHKPYDRSQKITLYAYDRVHGIYSGSEVKVTMDPASGIDSISPSEFRLETSEGGEFSFRVTKRTSDTTFYEILGMPLWIEPVSEVSESTTAIHTFRIAENLSGKERSAVMNVDGHDFKVSQIANAASLEPVERKLVTNLDSFTEIHPGTSFDIIARIESASESVQDLKYWAEIDGLTPSEVERYVGISPSGHVEVNRIWEGEKGVTLHVASPVYGFNESKAVKLSIDPKAGIESVSPAELTIDAAGNDIVGFKVTGKNDSFFPYDVESDSAWIAVALKETAGRDVLYEVSASPNPSTEDRIAVISLPGFAVTVTQKGFSGEATVPSSIVFDGFSPSWDGNNLYIGNEYAISAHVYPAGAPQDLKYSLKSRGTGYGHGSQNRFVDDDMISAFIELDSEKGLIKPFERGNSFYSPDYSLVISTPDGTVSTEVDFTITFDGKAGINGVDIVGADGNSLELESYGKSRTAVEVRKNTALSTVVGFESSESWLSARKIGERDGGLIEIWEIGAAPNRIGSSRSGTVTFIGSNHTRFSITVGQPGNPSPERHTEWVYGGVPPEPWEYADDQHVGGDYFEIYERSDIDQGWYLVTKSMLSNQSQTNPDERLCWAMSAASMIHWWGDHNEKYVEAFKDRHPEMSPAIDITYDRNAPLVKDKSSIIPIFTARHADTGGNTNIALLDILFRPRNTGSGELRDLGNGRYEWGDLPRRQYPGWFHEVFQGHEDEMVKISRSNQKSDFHRMIDEALVFDKAIGLNVHYYKVSGSGADHAMNVWGITYDENGEIVELVVGDNNLNSQRLSAPNLAYLTNYMVSYTPRNVVELWNPSYDMSDPEARAMGEVDELILLDLGTVHWERWAEENGVTI